MPRLSFLKPLRSKFLRLFADQTGGLLVTIAFAAPLVVGGLATGVETGMWYLAKRKAQQQADTAALGAARAKSQGITNYATLSDLATRDAVRNGFPEGAPNTIVVSDPPSSGLYAGYTNTVQATVTLAVALQFSKYFMSSSAITVRASAVAGTQINLGSGGGCILALHPSQSDAIVFNGSITAQLGGCTMVANSSDPAALKFNGSPMTVNAYSIYTRGGIVESGNVTIGLTTPAQTNQPVVIPDPYAAMGVASMGGCTQTSFQTNSGGRVTQISPGTYCNGLAIGGSANVNMAPGTYYIDKGNFQMTGHTTLTCTGCTGDLGVTIVLTSRDGTNIGTMDIGSNALVDLKPPAGASDYYRGVLMYQDRRASPGNAFKLMGTSATKVTGAVYAPAANISFNGNATLTAGRRCLQMIGQAVVFNGNTSLSVEDCAMYNSPTIAASGSGQQLRLLE